MTDSKNLPVISRGLTLIGKILNDFELDDKSHVSGLGKSYMDGASEMPQTDRVEQE